MPKDAWNKIEGEAWQLGVWSKWRTFAPGRRLVLSVPMLVGPWNRSGPKTGPHAGEPVSLAKGAAGEYDAHFEVLGRNLVKWGLADTIVRLGWEFNGGWYTYRAENEREARDFAKGRSLRTAELNDGGSRGLRFLARHVSKYIYTCVNSR